MKDESCKNDNLEKMDNDTLLNTLKEINVEYISIVMESLKRFYNGSLTDNQKEYFINIQINSSCGIFDSIDSNNLNMDDLTKGMQDFINIISDENR